MFRNTNQDGLENFFGCCKSFCGGKPIPSLFRTAYTTAIMNNLIGPVSEGSNCEPDQFYALLGNINEMLLEYHENACEIDEMSKAVNTEEQKQIHYDSEDNTVLIVTDIANNDVDYEDEMLDLILFDPLFGEELTFIENESITASAGKILQKLMKITTCDDCKLALQEPTEKSTYIDPNLIVFPSLQFNKQFEKIYSSLNIAIPRFCHENSIKRKIITHISNIQVDGISCEIHSKEIEIKLKDLTANYALLGFCNDINNILSGKTKVLPSRFNHIQKKAFEFRKQKNAIGKYSDKFTNEFPT